MNTGLKKLIDSLIKFNSSSNTNIDENILSSYLELSFATLETFFLKRHFLVKKGNKVTRVAYDLGLMSLLKLLSIRNDMLGHNVDLFYSLSIIDPDSESYYNTKYSNFVNTVHIYKLKLFREDSIADLKDINNGVINLVRSYLNNQ